MMSSPYTSVHDLTHLVGPLTEDSLVKCLQARFQAGLSQTLIGPQLVCVNDFTHTPSPRVLQTQRHPSDNHSYVGSPGDSCDLSPMSENGTRSGAYQFQARPDGTRQDKDDLGFMGGIVRTILSQHADSFHPQVVLVSGESGSGKTACSMTVLQQLLEMAGGGSQTDAYKYLSAALTVIRSLTCAVTQTNSESSRVGMYIENLTTDCLVYRTKIHCLLIDLNRICQVPRKEKSYHIFYQMLEGLTPEEKVKLHLSGFTIQNLHYLREGMLCEGRPEEKINLRAWKASLSVLGIPVSDVLRVLAAVLLLGNVQFVEGVGQELEVVGNNELKSVAALLGVSGVSLYRGFTTQTRVSHGQVCRTITNATSANCTRNSLARALYFRTLSAILRRINSMKRRTSHCTQSSESLESQGSSQYNNKPDILTPPLPNFLGLSLSKKSSESFIGILDLFGFETVEMNGLEQLCINLCAEAMQHYYNTHVFRSPADALYEEGIQTEVDVNFFNNTPVIELLSAQMEERGVVPQIRRMIALNEKPRGLLSLLDDITLSLTPSRQAFMEASSLTPHSQQLSCNFGFVSHLFSSEIKPSPDGILGPCGRRFRIHSSGQQDGESSPDCGHMTLSREFQSGLENILKSVTNAKPHFIRCIKSNDYGRISMFDCEAVSRQIRSLQITEVVQLMAGGLPHRLRYRMFNTRYRLFMPGAARHQRKNEPSQEECKAILTQFLRALDESRLPYISTQWSLGRKHIFYSEGTRQSLEVMRQEKLRSAAAKIQAAWRGFKVRKALRLGQKKTVNERRGFSTEALVTATPRPQLPPKGEKIEKVEPAVLEYVCKMWAIDLRTKPSLPPRRTYSVHGNLIISYPQSRCMNADYPNNSQSGQVFHKGDRVTVLGPAAHPGQLMVQRGDIILQVPYTYTDIQSVHETSSLNI